MQRTDGIAVGALLRGRKRAGRPAGAAVRSTARQAKPAETGEAGLPLRGGCRRQPNKKGAGIGSFLWDVEKNQ